MRCAAWLVVLVAVAVEAHSAVAAGPPRSWTLDTKLRVRKQVRKLARGIDKRSAERKLLYMVLLLHGGSTDEAIAFYKRNYKETEDKLFIRMAYGNALIEKRQWQDAASVFFTLSRKYPSNRLQAKKWYLHGQSFYGEGLDLGCYKAAIRFDPTYAAPYYQLGEQFDKQGPKMAVGFYVKALAVEEVGTALASEAMTGLLYHLETHPDAVLGRAVERR